MFSIPFAYGASWYDDGVNEFTYAKNMSIPTANYPDSDLTDFPFLVNITDADVSASAQSDCDDIVFTSKLNNSKLSHEIENCDLTANDWFTAWVKLPQVNSTGDNWWLMYYGDGDATSQEDVTGTWNSNYVWVHHLHDDFLDSTSNDCDITNTGSTDYPDTWIADSQSLDGSNDKLEVDDNGDAFNECLPSDTNGFYISLWASINGTCTGTQCSLVTHRPSLTANLYGQWSFYENAGELHFNIWNGAYLCIADTTGGSNYDDNVWRHYAVEYIDGAGGDCDIWVDGVEVETANKASAAGVNTDGEIDVGYQTRDNTDFFHGKLDQVSIQDAVVDPDWIEFEYCNQSEEDICDSLDVGAEGTEPMGGGGSHSHTHTESGTITDTLDFQQMGSMSLTESGTLTDSLAFAGSGTMTLTESGTISDDLVFMYNNLNPTLSESGTISDDLVFLCGGNCGDTTGNNAIVLFVKKDPFFFQSYTDATRMSCTANLAGGVIFNSDDGQLNICDGTNWTLPDGTST